MPAARTLQCATRTYFGSDGRIATRMKSNCRRLPTACWKVMSANDGSRPLLAMHGIHKHFPGVHALRGVDLEVRRGEVHALVGENGAGKSTLMHLLAGACQPDAGTIEFDGGEGGRA